MPKRLLVIPVIIVLVVTVADQLTKLWALANLADSQISPVLGQLLRFKLVFNRGGALGTEMGGGLFYLITSFIILIFVFYFITTHRHIRLIAWPLAFIAGGAIGNMIDRIRLGQVVDFIDLDFFDFSFFGRHIERWWTFNIADAGITVGVVVMLFYLIFVSKKDSAERHISIEDNNGSNDPINETS